MLTPINITIGEYKVCPLNADDLERFGELAEEVYHILSDEQTLYFIPEKRLSSKQDAVNWLRSSLVNFYAGRNFIHFIRSSETGRIAGIIDILSPALVREHYQLSSYPHFVEFYIKSELQGGSIMSRILPSVLQAVKEQDIDVIAAVADRKNYAARKVLERSGFASIQPFDASKDLFQTLD